MQTSCCIPSGPFSKLIGPDPLTKWADMGNIMSKLSHKSIKSAFPVTGLKIGLEVTGFHFLQCFQADWFAVSLDRKHGQMRNNLAMTNARLPIQTDFRAKRILIEQKSMTMPVKLTSNPTVATVADSSKATCPIAFYAKTWCRQRNIADPQARANIGVCSILSVCAKCFKNHICTTKRNYIMVAWVYSVPFRGLGLSTRKAPKFFKQAQTENMS